MTIFAGVFRRNPNGVIDESVRLNLRSSISRDSRDDVVLLGDHRCLIAKVDIGVYGERGVCVNPSGSVSILAGEPSLRLNNEAGWRSRTVDLEELHDGWERNDFGLLRSASGAFCAAHYDPTEGAITLVADKLCIRPLYYWITDEYVAFATSLRIFEAVDLVPKQMDLRAITQLVTLGLPIGTRTPYANIHLLKAAEIVQVSANKVSRQQYWRWDQVPQSTATESELLAECHDRFRTAIKRRLRNDTSAVATLSGGLDSRSVVAELRSLGSQVHTLNFAGPDAQDRFFASELAREIGTLHEEFPAFATPEWTLNMSRVWNESGLRSVSPPERPNIFWSGDGGSVGFGHVYVGRKIVELLRRGEKDRAIKEFLVQQGAHVPQKLLKRALSAELSNTLHDEIRKELDDIQYPDPGRGFYIFLLLNDQRRHLFLHFEGIDLHRLEFQLAFYDSDFLASVVSTPVDLCVEHKFYVKWLKYLHPAVMRVPWQSYPGHEPCPLPMPEGLSYQWSGQLHNTRRPQLLAQARELIRAKDFPGEILNHQYLRLTTLLYRINLREYGYLIQAASTYHKYWALCRGRYDRST